MGSGGNVSASRRFSPLDYYFELVGWPRPFLDIQGTNDLRLTGFGIFLVADRVLSFSFLCKVQFVFCHPTPPLAPAIGYIKTLLRFRPHPHPSQRPATPASSDGGGGIGGGGRGTSSPCLSRKATVRLLAGFTGDSPALLSTLGLYGCGRAGDQAARRTRQCIRPNPSGLRLSPGLV